MTLARHIDGTGFPILWIHGFPLSAEVFARQTSIAGYKHIRPDLRGFGETRLTETMAMTMRDYARDLVDLLDELKVHCAVVAGLSMGGYVAMQLLRDAPERVAALILLSTRETPDTPEGKDGRYKSAREVEANGTSSVVESMLPKMVVQDQYRDEVRRIMESASAEGVIAALQAMAARGDSAEVLGKTKVPALIVAGDQDKITTVSDAERMASLLECAQVVVIKGAAHLANVECAEEVNAAILSFLREYPLDCDSPAE